MTSPFPIICARDGLGFNHFFHDGYVATVEMEEARGMTSLTSFPIICARDGLGFNDFFHDGYIATLEMG